jgi:hypothetical protein
MHGLLESQTGSPEARGRRPPHLPGFVPLKAVTGDGGNDSIDILRNLLEGRQHGVRYGRAQLTVFRFGGLTDGDLGAAIQGFEEGEIDAEALAWSFVRHRVVKHTPSFSWDDADLSLLLDRVVGVSTDPTFESSAPEDVAQILVEGAQAEREARDRMRESSKRVARSMSDRFGLGAGLRPIFDSVQHTLGARYATDMKFQGILGLNSKLAEPGLAIQSPGLFRAREQVQKNLGAKYGTGKFDLLGLDGKHKFDQLMPKAVAAELFGLHRPLYPKTLDPAAFDLRLRPIVGLENRFGLADFSAVTAISKSLKYNGHPPWLRGVGEQLARFNKDWIERLKKSYPANWRDLTQKEIDAAAELMLDPGLSLAWVPRIEILRELLAAEDDETRTFVLEARSADIVNDVEQVFDEVTLPELAMTIDYAKKAVAAHKNGHTEAALALAAATLSNIVHDYMGETNFGPIRETFADVDPENDVGMEDFALYMVGKVWVKVNVRFEGNEDPGFNRNRTLHLIGAHYSRANLIAVLMLLAGLCRELHRFDARNDASADEAAQPALEVA